jgi:hypothetical protein
MELAMWMVTETMAPGALAVEMAVFLSLLFFVLEMPLLLFVLSMLPLSFVTPGRKNKTTATPPRETGLMSRCHIYGLVLAANP